MTLSSTLSSTDHYTIISADCHAGASHEAYREYLEARYLDDFDAWREKYRNPFSDLRGNRRTRSIARFSHSSEVASAQCASSNSISTGFRLAKPSI